MFRRSRFERFLVVSAVLTFAGFAIAGYLTDQKKLGTAAEATHSSISTISTISAVGR